MNITFSYIDSVSGDTQVMNFDIPCKWVQADTTPGQLVNAFNDEITRQTGEPSHYVLDHFHVAGETVALCLHENNSNAITTVAGIAFRIK